MIYLQRLFSYGIHRAFLIFWFLKYIFLEESNFLSTTISIYFINKTKKKIGKIKWERYFEMIILYKCDKIIKRKIFQYLWTLQHQHKFLQNLNQYFLMEHKNLETISQTCLNSSYKYMLIFAWWQGINYKCRMWQRMKKWQQNNSRLEPVKDKH